MADELLKGSNRMDAVVWLNLIERKQETHGFRSILIELLLKKTEIALILRRCNDSKTCRDNTIDWGLDEEVVKLAFKPIRWVCH